MLTTVAYFTIVIYSGTARSLHFDWL